MAFASPKMVTLFLYITDNVIDVNFKNLKCRSQDIRENPCHPSTKPLRPSVHSLCTFVK